MKTPVFVVSIAHRYHEFCHNLPDFLEQAYQEIGILPPVIIVWSQPEITKTWVFYDTFDILNNRWQNYHSVKQEEIGGCLEFTDTPPLFLLTRNGDKSCPISYNCAQDMHTGFQFIFDNPNIFGNPENLYTVFHCCDVNPNPGTYKRIHDLMNNGYKAFLIQMYSAVMNTSIWHTNFFSVSLDSEGLKYLPPVIEKTNPDILEAAWAKVLIRDKLKNYIADNNNKFKVFKHIHSTEENSPYENFPDWEYTSCPIFVATKKRVPIWLKLMQFLIPKKKLYLVILTGYLFLMSLAFRFSKIIMKSRNTLLKCILQKKKTRKE